MKKNGQIFTLDENNKKVFLDPCPFCGEHFEECLIDIEHMEDIPGEQIEEKCYRAFTDKAQPEAKYCSECGKPMEKKEIIIKGDEDTCDECLCPE